MIPWERFLALAKEQFVFLESEYGYHCASEKMPFLTYSSEKIDIMIFYDINRQGEVDLGVQRKTDIGKRIPLFRLPEFKRLLGLISTSTSPFPDTEEEFQKVLSALAEDLKNYCLNVLKGGLEDFTQIERQREKSLQEYMRTKRFPV